MEFSAQQDAAGLAAGGNAAPVIPLTQAQSPSSIDLASLADSSLRELLAKPVEHQDQIRSALRGWFDGAPKMLTERWLEQAVWHAGTFELNVQAVRRGDMSCIDAASRALDDFVMSARSTIECAGATPPANGQADEIAGADLPALDQARSLQRNFELQTRSLGSGTLESAEFMSGHQLLVAEALKQLREHSDSLLWSHTDARRSHRHRETAAP